MYWMNATGAWAFLALAVIIGLYILKQRTEPLEVSSTYLWQKALASQEADRPFQKLRRSLLLLLQLILAALLAFGLMRPMSLGDISGEYVFVFDLSASMQADDGQGSRMEKAIQDAKRRIDGFPDGVRVSILTAGSQVRQVLSRTADRQAAKRGLDALAAENTGADLDGAMSLALALRDELPSLQIVVYTDQPLDGAAVTRVGLGGGCDNRAVLSLSASGASAVARIVNYGGEAEVTIECEADGALRDIRTAALPAGDAISVAFDIPENSREVTVRIVEQDAIAGDNLRHWVYSAPDTTIIVLAGRDNVFLEKALALRPDVTVLKTTPEEAARVRAGSLTVFDGPLPGELPERGALLLIDPDSRVGEPRATPVSLSAATGALANRINEYLQVDDIQVARWKPVVGGEPIWLADGAPVLSLLEEDGRRIALLGFDVHDANLPLLKEFPLFLQRLLDYLAPEPLGGAPEDAGCGDTLPITPQSNARSAAVLTPSGRRVLIPLMGGALEDTKEIGVYRLVQADETGQEWTTPFALHIPGAESDVRQVPTGSGGEAAGGRGITYGREWTPWIIGLLLAVMLIEWWVYRRGY